MPVKNDFYYSELDTISEKTGRKTVSQKTGRKTVSQKKGRKTGRRKDRKTGSQKTGRKTEPKDRQKDRQPGRRAVDKQTKKTGSQMTGKSLSFGCLSLCLLVGIQISVCLAACKNIFLFESKFPRMSVHIDACLCVCLSGERTLVPK